MRPALLILVVLVIMAPGCSMIAPESAVFHDIAVGDSEKKLVDALTGSRVAFHKGEDGGKTVYSHSDGFMGIYFYFVKDGRIIDKAVD